MIAVWVGIGLAAAAAAAGARYWLRGRYLVVTVRGLSMAPTYQQGDRVLVRRQRPGRIRPGQIVVVDIPESMRPLPSGLTAAETLRQRRVIKRVIAVAGDAVPPIDGLHLTEAPPGSMVLLGDNPMASGDSRQYGPVPLDAAVGVVVRRMGAGAPVTTATR